MPKPNRRRWPHAGLAVLVATGTALLGVAVNGASAATLFTDTFDDGNADGWARNGGSWSVVTDGTPVLRQTSTSATARALAGDATWSDSAVQVRVKPLAFNGADRPVSVLIRARNTSNYVSLSVRSSGRLELARTSGGTSTVIATAPAVVTPGTWYTLRLQAIGSALAGSILNGGPAVTGTDPSPASGRIGLATLNASAEFDDVLVDSGGAPGGTTTTTTTVPVPTTTGNPVHPTDLVGFASVNAWGQNGTTGGSGGPTVTVSTAADLLDSIARPGPYVIRVNGMITLPGPMHDVTSDKTIVGIGSASGITGAGFNIGIPIDDAITSPPANAVHNVIIRNLVFTNAKDDSINVQMYSHHVWIDHNDLSKGYDGLVDIKRGASYITVSWNHTHNHTKNMLLGRDDSDTAQDTGRLKVTYHHNWFDRTPQRNPRVRFGEPVHVFNNLYVSNTDVGVACQTYAGCVIEGNYFEDVEEPFTNSYAGPKGRITARNNVFVGESGTGEGAGGSVEEPSAYYSYTVDDPNAVKAIVTAGAGVGHTGD